VGLRCWRWSGMEERRQNNLFGITSGFLVGELPATVTVTVFARIRFDVEEAGPHECSFTCSGPDGDFQRIAGQTIAVDAFEDETVTFSHIHVGLNVSVRALGEYVLCLEIDGKKIADAVIAFAAIPLDDASALQ
jgi:hypothetical protein